MDEYISKQSVIDYLKGYLNSIGECGADSLLFDRGQRRALINSIQDISVIKGADVQPVKQGQWKLRCYGDYLYCSNCNNEPKSREMTLFCPNCGAKMGGDSE